MNMRKPITRSDIRIEYKTTPSFYSAIVYHGDKFIYGTCTIREVYSHKKDHHHFAEKVSSLEINIAQYINYYNEQIKKENEENDKL